MNVDSLLAEPIFPGHASSEGVFHLPEGDPCTTELFKQAEAGLNEIKWILVSQMHRNSQLLNDERTVGWLLEYLQEKSTEKRYTFLNHIVSRENFQHAKRVFQFVQTQAGLGNIFARSTYALMLGHGFGCKADTKLSFELFKQNAEAGNGKDCYNVGVFYDHDGTQASYVVEGLSNDPLEATKWYIRAGDNGLRVGYFSAAQKLLLTDPGKAREYLEKAVEHKVTQAMYTLASLKLSGEHGTPQNSEEAVSLLEEATQLGCLSSQVQLANILFSGYNDQTGRKRKNVRRAKSLMMDAAQKGNQGAALISTLWSIMQEDLYEQEDSTAPTFAVDPVLEKELKKVGEVVGDHKPTCFIARCYTGEESEILEAEDKINYFLRLMGIKTIYDTNGDNDGLAVGADTSRYMEQGIRNCDFVLYCMTPKTLERSKMIMTGCHMELIHVCHRLMSKKPSTNQSGPVELDSEFLIPVLISGEKRTAVPPELQTLLYISGIDNTAKTFSIRALLKEMWPLFSQRIFKYHPKAQEITITLQVVAKEVGFIS